MNELEKYVASLQDQNLSEDEIKAKVKAWKAANQPLKQEETDVEKVELQEDNIPTKSYFKDDGSGEFNPDAFEDETSRNIAVQVNKDAKKAKDSAGVILDVESKKPKSESQSEDFISDSYFTRRGDDIIFDLEAFANKDTRNVARQVNLPEVNKTYSIGAGEYKMDYNANGIPVFYSRPIGSNDWSSANDDPLRTAVIAQKLGIGDPNFNVDDYDIEPPMAPPVEDEEATDTDINQLDEVPLTVGGVTLIAPSSDHYKIDGVLYNTDALRESIRTNQPGFEDVTGLDDYLTKLRKNGHTVEAMSTNGYEGSLEEKFDNYVNDTNITTDQELEIEAEVNAIDFTPYTQEFTTGGGGSSLTGYTPTTTLTKEIQPYEEELTRAREIIKQQKKDAFDETPITQIEVEAVARTLIKQDKILSKHNQLKKDYLEDLPNKEREELFEFVLNRFRDNERLFGGDELPDSFTDPETGVTYDKKELEERFNFESRFEKVLNGKTANNIRVVTQAIDKNKIELESLYNQIKEGQANGFDVTALAEKYNSVITLMNKRIKGVNTYKKELNYQYQDVALDYQNYISRHEEYKGDAYELEWLKRNYSQMLKYFPSPGDPGDLLINTSQYFLGGIQQLLGLINMSGGIAPSPDITSLQFRLGKMQSDFIDYRNRRKERFVKAPVYDESFSSMASAAEYLVDQGFEMGPFYGIMIGGSLVGGPLFGMVAASATSGGMYTGERFNEMYNGGRGIDIMDLNAAAVGFSTLEYFGGVLPTWKIFKSLKTRWSGTVGNEVLESGFKNWGRRQMSYLPEHLKLVGLDVFGETAITQVGQNIIDGRPYWTGVDEAGYLSLIFANTVSVTPVVMGGVYNALATPKMTTDFKNNVEKIRILESSLYDLRFKTPTFKSSLSAADILSKKNEIIQLQDANADILIQQNKKLKNIDVDGFRIYTDAMTRLAELKTKAEKINNDSSLTRSEKEVLLKPLRAEFEIIVSARNQYVEAFTKTFPLLPKSEQERLKIEGIRKLKIKGVDNPTEKQIFDAAEQAHTTEKFNNNKEKSLALLESLVGKGIDVNYEIGESNKITIQKYKNMLLARLKDPNNNLDQETYDTELQEFIIGIEQGTINGSTFVSTVTDSKGNEKLVYDVIVSQQNSVANAKSETAFHELNHVIASEAIGTDPAAFQPVANSILAYLADNDINAYNRVVGRTLKQTPDEIIMVFLEELAEGRINVEKATEFNFWNVLGFGMNNSIKNAANNDNFNLDLSGQNGALRFFQTLAEAYKDKALTVSALESVLESDAWLDSKGEEVTLDLDEVVITGSKKSQSISSRGIQFIEGAKEGIYSNEDLVTIVRGTNDTDRYAAAEAIVERNFGLISGIIGFERRGTQGVSVEGVKQALIEIILGGDIAKWSGKTTPLFEEGEGFNPDTAQVTTFLGRLRNRGEIFERARDLGDTVVDQTTTQDEGTTEIPEVTTTQETVVETDPFKVLPNVDVQSVVDAVSQEIELGNLDIDNVTLKDLKPFSEAAAQQIADELGIPVSRILNPKDNLRKGEVTPIQMFIKKNGPALLALLKQVKGNADLVTVTDSKGRTKKIGGEGRRIAQKILDAFFIKGDKVNNQIQYKLDLSKLNLPYFYSVFGIDSSGNIKDARSEFAQAAKGWLELLARLQTLSAIEAAIDIQVEQGTITEAEGKRKKVSVKRSKTPVVYDHKKGKFIIDKRFTDKKTGTRVNSKGQTVNVRTFDLATADGVELVSTLNDFIKLNPSLGYLFRSGMTGGFNLTFNKTGDFDKAIPGVVKIGTIGRSKYTLVGGLQSSTAITKIINDFSKQGDKLKLLKKLFVKIEDYLKDNPDKAWVFQQFLIDGTKDQNHPLRFLAPTTFYAIDPITGKINIKNKVTEEHMQPAVEVGKTLLDAAIKGQVESVFDDVISKSYAQGGLLEVDDLVLKAFGLNESMPKSFYEKVIPLLKEGKLDFLKDGLASWIRYSENNVANPFSYKLMSPNITIGEFFVGKLDLKGLNIPKADFNVALEMAGLKANGLITQVLTGEITLKQAKAEFKVYRSKILPLKVKAFNNINTTFGKKTMLSETVTNQIEVLSDYAKAIEVARDPNAPKKGISVLDFDDTVAITNSKVIVTMPDGTVKSIDATEFALNHEGLESMGATFDFSDFNKVVGGKRGPLFNKLKKAVDKFGNTNVFILTARAPEAAPAIFEWLKSENIILKQENIVGLANGSPQAKANWMVSKAAEGYNDFYFADDAILNVNAVQAVYDVLDVKGRAHIALRSKQNNFDTIMNDIIEKKTGIASYKNYSAAKAKTIGAGKGRYDFYIPPSAEDFTGLLYKLLAKGKVGDAQMAFFKDNLLDPYNRAEIEIESAKIAAANDFNALKAAFPDMPNSLKKETGIGKFTFEHAIRAYIWGKQGVSIPGLSKRDLKRLTDFVTANADLKVFADELVTILKGEDYPAPGQNWVAGTITTDVIGNINKVGRAKYLTEWQENVDIIFSEKNLNKLEAAFGSDYVKALKNSLSAMKRGSNRSSNTDSITEAWYDWINNSVGVVMFLNTRSAFLQMISNINFINWKDNNPYQAAKALANQPQYWQDVMFLLNSSYLQSRRDGLKINISESEIADLATSKDGNKIQKFIALALNKGFVFTRYADSFAIATGGATFYRNRVNSYLKEGMSQETAEKQAFEDFREVSETSQQSSNPMKISDQQRSAAGRLILSFGNTQMQYARIQKRAIQDLIAGRGDWREHVSKIVYYGGIQNLMFNALQQGVQFLLFDGDEADEKDQTKRSQRIERTLNGMFDSQVRGIGIQGALVVTLKNVLMEIAEQAGKKTPEYAEAVDALFSISPPVQAKLRKLNSAANTFSWNMKEMKEQGIDIDNPAYLAVAQTISALTNLPTDEAVLKINAMRNILSDQTEAWQKVALLLGWGTWDVGLPYYGVEDKVIITPEMEAEIKIENMMKETTKPEQVKTLKELGLTNKEIKALKYEKDRVNKIIELQNKKEDGK